MGKRLKNRIDILKSFDACDGDIQKLLDYNKNVFDHSLTTDKTSFPLKDEPFIDDWLKYSERSKQIGVFGVLKEILIQLNFPIMEGISKTDEYLAAVKRGILPENNLHEKLQINEPDKIGLTIHQTLAGKIPIISVSNREDFITLIRAISKSNEPLEITDSFGASMFSGYNNWNRIQTYKDKFLEDNSPILWNGEFQKLIKNKHLYQDKFIILSNSYYSGVKPELLGLEENEWKEKSLIIRQEHECTHFFTKQVFSSMRNNIFDEIMADYAGLITAFGEFRADWFLTFLGLEKYPHYREGGRLEIYKGDLAGNAFIVLQKLIISAAHNLEKFSKKHNTSDDILRTIMALAKLTLEELASEDAADLLK